MSTEEIYNILQDTFKDDIIELVSDLPVEQIIVANSLKINEISQFLRDSDNLQFDSLMNLSGVDDNNAENITNEDGSVEKKGGTLSIYYHLYSTKLNHKVTIKVSTDRDNPEIESVVDIWGAANWHEREAFDMFGINFLNHPDLRRILLPDDWDGFPLRKDYENPEYYGGMKIPY